MSGVRSAISTNDLAAAASRPGADPRVWLTLAAVDDIYVDANEGVFVDITYLPDGTQETAYLGAPYSGNGFGLFCPPEIGDTVVVAVPLGDPNEGAVIVARYWNASDPPLAEARNGDAVSQDVSLRIRTDRNFRVRAAGTGGVSTVAEGTGDVTTTAESGDVTTRAGNRVELDAGVDIVATAPLVKLAEALAAESFVRGTTFAAQLNAYLAAAQAQSTADALCWEALNTLFPNPLFVASKTAAQAAAAAAQTLIAAMVPGVALSTKIYGD